MSGEIIVGQQIVSTIVAPEFGALTATNNPRKERNRKAISGEGNEVASSVVMRCPWYAKGRDTFLFGRSDTCTDAKHFAEDIHTTQPHPRKDI